ncbi:hypothetical protein J6590_089576, partial [Homalodisca vitripennis]
IANKGRKYGIWKEEDMERAMRSFKNGAMGINAFFGYTRCRKKTLNVASSEQIPMQLILYSCSVVPKTCQLSWKMNWYST